MKQIKEKIDKLPLIIKSIIYGITISTCTIAVVILLFLIIYIYYEFLLKPVASILGPVALIIIIIWTMMTILFSIIAFCSAL